MATYNITVTSDSNSTNGWRFTGSDKNGSIADVANPSINVFVADIIYFTFEQGASHPFRIGSFGDYTGGVYAWNAPGSATVVTYECTNHPESMSGSIGVNAGTTGGGGGGGEDSTTTTTAPITTTTAGPSITTTLPPFDPPYDPRYFDPTVGEEEYERTHGVTPTSASATTTQAPDNSYSSISTSGPAHEVDTEELDDLSGYQLLHSRSPIDANQNPQINKAHLLKTGGDDKAVYPFKGRLTVEDSKISFFKGVEDTSFIQDSPSESYNDPVGDVGDPNSYFRFWFVNGVEVDHRSVIIDPFLDMLSWGVNKLDDYGNITETNNFRGVSFLRPQFIKRTGAAYNVLSGTHQWTRTADVNLGGGGRKVSPMSNSEEQVDLDLIGGTDFINILTTSEGVGVMALSQEPTTVKIIQTPPTRYIYSKYSGVQR